MKLFDNPKMGVTAYGQTNEDELYVSFTIYREDIDGTIELCETEHMPQPMHEADAREYVFAYLKKEIGDFYTDLFDYYQFDTID